MGSIEHCLQKYGSIVTDIHMGVASIVFTGNIVVFYFSNQVVKKLFILLFWLVYMHIHAFINGASFNSELERKQTHIDNSGKTTNSYVYLSDCVRIRLGN